MKQTFPEFPDQYMPATLIRRLLAILYDWILCIALTMVVTMIYMGVSHKVLGAETYKALNESGATSQDPFLTLTLASSLFLFFAYFWTKTGQTLGMQVWHLRVQNEDNTSISWKQAFIRFFVAGISTACFGLGYAWMLVDKKQRTWQCIASNTQIQRIPKRK